MKTLFDVSTPAKRFRLVAVIEAITWAGLLLGMYFKYAHDMDSATQVPGMVHGIVFVGFVIISIITAKSLSWNWKVLVLALVSSIPPFFSVIFEWWAQRNGKLAELSSQSVGREAAEVA